MAKRRIAFDHRWYAPIVHHYTFREYLELERDANVRHEYLDGEIYAMAGGSRAHALRCVNISSALHAQLRGKRCAVHSPDMKVCVLASGLTTYPDVSVVCGHAELHPDSDHVITNPVVIVEVLSPSTEDWDRGEKLDHYKQIPSLRDVALVAHDRRHLEVWSRGSDDTWSRTEVVSGTARLPSIDCTLVLDDVYLDPLAVD